MIEIFDELRLKDYLSLGLVLLLFVFIINLPSLINRNTLKINPQEYETEVMAQITTYRPINRKSETLVGSKLTPIGYNLSIEYEIDSTIRKDIKILYSSYDIHQSIIDKMVTNPDNILPIRLKKGYPHEVVLNISPHSNSPSK